VHDAVATFVTIVNPAMSGHELRTCIESSLPENFSRQFDITSHAEEIESHHFFLQRLDTDQSKAIGKYE